MQKFHANNRIKHGKERKITAEEFLRLLNAAYAFLGIVITAQQADTIFQQADSDRDGLITYVQYFDYIDKFLASKAGTTVSNSGDSSQRVTGRSSKELFSRLRRLLWEELRRLYQRYDTNRNDRLDAK